MPRDPHADPSPRAIVVTGPECTGKTTLAAALARHFDTAWSAEYAREYAERHPPLVADDIHAIARGQIAAEDRARADAVARGAAIVVHDTDLVSTVVYGRHYYGACPTWIEDAARTRRASLYLLSTPDMPWIADGVRDRPESRDALYEEFRAVLEELGCAYVPVRGPLDARLAASVALTL